MKEIIVTSQKELDALPIDFAGRIVIKFGTRYNRAIVRRRFRFSVEAWGNSSVIAWGNSSVIAWGKSSVVARGNSSVEARGNSSVEASGNSQVCDSTRTHKINTSANARIVYNPRTVLEYLNHYQIEHSKTAVKLYKAVHKRNDRFYADHYVANWFEYVVGDEAEADYLDVDPAEDCGHGIHMAYKEWCVDYGRDWKDLAIIEVEAELDKIIVPLSGCGKVRTDKVKVIREVPLEECGLLGKIIAKRKEK